MIISRRSMECDIAPIHITLLKPMRLVIRQPFTNMYFFPLKNCSNVFIFSIFHIEGLYVMLLELSLIVKPGLTILTLLFCYSVEHDFLQYDFVFFLFGFYFKCTF